MPTSSILQFQRDGNRLLASYIHGADRVDSRSFSDAGLLEKWAGDYVDIMERALAFPQNDHREPLEDFGRCLFDNLMTGELAHFIRELPGPRAIMVDMPESLLWLPVEAMFDGQEFLGTRHAIGRRITAWEGGRAKRPSVRMDGRDRPAFLLVAGYAEDEAFFEATRNEIYDLCAAIERADVFELRELLVDNALGRSELLRALSAADFIHFSGHSDAGPEEGRAGWLFETFRLSPEDIASLSGCDPYMVFSNSCRSSAISNWREVRDMVRAFWERGTQHFIGANTRIHYKRAAEFAEVFYKHFLRGESIGESMRQARLAVLKNPAHQDVCWLSYVLYGDPRFRIADSNGLEDSAEMGRKALQWEKTPVPEATAAEASAAGEKSSLAAAGEPRTRGGGGAEFAHSATFRSSAAHLGHLAHSGHHQGAPAPKPEPPPLCAWTGKPLFSMTSAVQCAHPGCGKLLGVEAQMEQRRLRLDQSIHAGRPAGIGFATRACFCPEHLPEDLRAWIERTQKAATLVQSGEAVCAWTDRAATRSEAIANAFKKTSWGWASPEAIRDFTCPATGEMIPPELIKRDLGFIHWRGKNYSEEGYWKALGCSDRKPIDEKRARAAELRSRQGMVERLRALTEAYIANKKYAFQWGETMRDLPSEGAWSFTLGGGWLSGSRRVGLIQRAVFHADHFERFGRDRQPATLADLERAFQYLEPLPKHPETLFILSSPTGWSDEARDHARDLEPSRGATLILRNSANRGEPLAFNRHSEIADALKLDLAGGLGAV
jgi:hypothetical protein